MIVDTDGTTCVKASFSFGGDAITRQYEVRVLQYGIRNSLGGPPGCLQFHIGTTGTVTTFNWQADLAGMNFFYPGLAMAVKQCSITGLAQKKGLPTLQMFRADLQTN